MCRGGRCMVCGEMSFNPIPVKDRNGNGYLCDLHKNSTESYYSKNTKKFGVEKVNGFTFGVEFETANSTEVGRIEMANMGYLPTHDDSLAWSGVEYKSPIYQGMNAIIKHCVSIGVLVNDSDISIDSDCGTHLHVGHSEHINPVTMGYIRRFYHSLFIPLSNAIAADPAKAARFWGRKFTYYASAIDTSSDPEEHRNFINLQHDYTIEFRLCKFQSGAQYQNCVRFAKDVITTIINNFIVHFNDTDYNTAKFKNQREYRKHQAEKTAKKIVMLYAKYTANI